MVIYIQELVTTKCFINAEDEVKIRAYAKEHDMSLVDSAIELIDESVVDMWDETECWDSEMENMWADEEK